MTLQSSLGLGEWSANQASPEIPVNTGIAFALVIGGMVLKGKDTNTPPGSPSEGDGYIVGGAATGAWSAFAAGNVAVWHNGAWIEVTALDQMRAYVNDGSGGTDVWEYDGAAWGLILTGGATTWLGLTDTPGSFSGAAGKLAAVNAGATALEFKASPYDVPVIQGSAPTAGEVIGRFTLARAIDFPADFAGSVGSVETNPAASFAIDVQDDGTSIGTITISTGGAYTFATDGGTAKTVAAGSKLEFIAPTPADGSIDGISLMLRASTVDL